MEIANRLQISLEQLAAHLTHVPDTEFDHEGKIVGRGITLVPTPHHFWVEGHALFTWCAFSSSIKVQAALRSFFCALMLIDGREDLQGGCVQPG